MERTAVHLGQRALLEPFTTNDAWALTTYDACSMRCTYCITETQGVSRPRLPAEEVTVRLAAELADVEPHARICVGPFTDVYPEIEADERVTRAALEVIHAAGRPFNLVTKGLTATRDIDLFHHPLTFVQVSVCTTDPGFVARYEPGAAPADERIAMANQLVASGVNTVLQCAPWIPGVSDVAAIRSAVDERISVQVTPLRVPARLVRAIRAFEFDQRSINAAYREAFEANPHLPRVRWSRPPPLDGAAPHITDNFGTHTPTTWDPAEPSPRFVEPLLGEVEAALARAYAAGEILDMSTGVPKGRPQGRRSRRS